MITPAASSESLTTRMSHELIFLPQFRGFAGKRCCPTSRQIVIVNTTASEDIIMDTKNVCGADGGREAFIFFRKTDSVVEEEKKIRAEIRRKGQYAKYTLEDILGNSEKMRICKEKTKQCAKF